AGLLALSLGLSANFADDHEMLEHGLVMYDALYAWWRSCLDEKHIWNAAAAFIGGEARDRSDRQRHDPAASGAWRLVRRGAARLAARRGIVLRRSGRADRGHAPHHRQREEMDRREPVSACAELLHAAARPRGAAARDLYRLADASLAGRDRRRRLVRRARHRLDHGAELDLCFVWPGADRRGLVLRAEGSGIGDRALCGLPRRQPRLEKRRDDRRG